MKPWYLMTVMAILLATGLAVAAPGADKLVMSRTAQVLGSGGPGRYQLEVTLKLEAGTNVAAGLTALAVEEVLPAGWVYESVAASPAPATVNALAGNTCQFVWVNLPNLSSPFEFKYYVNYPTAASGEAIVGTAPYRTNGGQLASEAVTTPQNAISCLEMSRSVAGYEPGKVVTVEVTLKSFCGEPVTALAVEETWPPGWTYVSSSGVGLVDGTNAPTADAQGTLQFFWFSPIPTFPYTFSYEVRAPVTATGPVTMSGQSISRLSGPELRTPLVDSTLVRLDTTPPVITLNGSNPMTVECATAFTDPSATATDNVDGTVPVSSSGTVNRFAPGQYTITYSATDRAGNTATLPRTVNVVDTTAPVITRSGSNPVTVQCGGGYSDAGATAIDSCAGDRTASIAVANPVNTAVVGVYTVRYNVSDGNGNNAAEVTRTVNVVDTTAPVITRSGANPVTVQCGGSYRDAGATAADICAGDRTASIVVTNPVNTAAVGVYTVRYNVGDGNGNNAAEVTRTVNVVDTTVPVISRTGANPVTVQCGGVYSDAGATANDICAGDRTASIVVTNPVNTAAVGAYTVRYNVSDGNGNNAVEVTRTVNVVDTTVPVITLLGAGDVTVQCGGTYSDAGATASDICAGDRTNSILVTNPVNTAVVGTYTVLYNVSDGNGNNAVEVTRTVTVEDTDAPVITLAGANPLTLDCGAAFTDPGASALDACDGTVAATSDAPEINTNFPASYVVTYTATDSHGLSSTKTRSVVVGGPNCDYCPMTDVVILHPAEKILIPSTVPQVATVLSSEVLFANSADCMEGTVQVSYTVNGIEYVPTSDRQNNFPITLLLAPGDYTMKVEATLVETGQIISAEKLFSVVSVPISANGYPMEPFTMVTPDGTRFSNTIHANGFNRSIEMVAALCAEDGGSAEDITMTVNYDGDITQTLTVKVPRVVVPCGSQALVTVTVSDTIEGLLGRAEAPYFVPVPGGLIAGGLFFDISILVADLADVANGEPVTYSEIDNTVIEANPVSFSLSGLAFAPNLIPVYLSHPSSFAPEGAADLNLFGDTADWSDDYTSSFLVEGNTLHGQATSLSVFAPFEKEKVLTFSPDIEYGVIFGRAVIATSIDQVFTVTNNGTLRASGTATIVDENGVFTLVGTGTYSLAPGESFDLTVRFTPTEVKDYEGTLNFSGVPNTDLSVRVLGTGTMGPKKKCLSVIGCAPLSQGGSGGDLLVLAAAFGLLAAGRVRRALRRHS
jgi:hypothetical protein